MLYYDPPAELADTVFDPTSDTFGPIMAALQAGDFETAASLTAALAPAASTARKRTKFQTCERHRSLDALPRRRRAEFFVEGGPSGEAGCQGGTCRLWPGTDLFEASICHGELALDWTTDTDG